MKIISQYFLPTDNLNSRKHTPNKIRHELSSLSSRDVASLKAALTSLQKDDGPDGYQAIAAFHGLPAQCHDTSGHQVNQPYEVC